jgi:hypothetical protein
MSKNISELEVVNINKKRVLLNLQTKKYTIRAIMRGANEIAEAIRP